MLAQTVNFHSRRFANGLATRVVGFGKRQGLHYLASVSTVGSRGFGNYHNNQEFNSHYTWGAAAAAASIAAASGIASSQSVFDSDNQRSSVCQCDAGLTPSSVPTLDEDEEIDDDKLPIIRMSEVERNNGQQEGNDGEKSTWMSYGGYVYDVTDFIANHPGGSEKIMLAAGGPIEPHWHLYRQHFASDLPQRLMEKMVIGKLHEDDQDAIDTLMDKITNPASGGSGDPYEHEPLRHPSLKVHSDTPMNAEVPSHILNQEYITPVELFYIRHHHPVPLLSDEDVEKFRLEVDLSLLSNDQSSPVKDSTARLTLDQIKSLPKVEVTTTLQCSGNRRSGFNDLRRTSGTPWGQGAISTAKWGGARLVDVLALAAEELSAEEGSGDKKSKKATKKKKKASKGKGSEPLIQTLQQLQTLLQDHPKFQHLRFESLDGMMASIDVVKALNPFGDVIIAYEMNGVDLPRDHGFPLRVIVPGYAAVRNVKWLSKLELAEEEAEGAWQRGLNYKVLPPAVVDAKQVNLDVMPGLGEVSVFSGITDVTNVRLSLEKGEVEDKVRLKPGQTVMVKASGWAWAGGGRNIVRVDVSGNNGETWETSTMTKGSEQPHGRAWAWTFWECDGIPARVCDDGCSVELCCKGVDSSFNTQPESSDGLWNVRGLANNSWFKVTHRLNGDE
mmetsp:Transcript_8984/g.19105  ORF Transcript_8984/g.19105 Transcript_8984/m.19105 type:complete len:670 (+) Transcript_8984:264-2273(+)